MTRAVSVVRRPAVKTELVADRITLAHEARNRRRLAMTAEGGLDFLLDLPRPMALGDALALEDRRLVEVRAAETPLRLARIAWHLGNRHTPAEVKRLVIPRLVRGIHAKRQTAASTDPWMPWTSPRLSGLIRKANLSLKLK